MTLEPGRKSEQVAAYAIIDATSPRNPDLIVKEDRIEKVLLVQMRDNKDGLLGLGLLKDKAVVFEPGRMNFHTTHGGENALREFRGWLRHHNLFARVDQRLGYITEQGYEQMLTAMVFDTEKDLVRGHDATAEERFSGWVSGNEW